MILIHSAVAFTAVVMVLLLAQSISVVEPSMWKVTSHPVSTVEPALTTELERSITRYLQGTDQSIDRLIYKARMLTGPKAYEALLDAIDGAISDKSGYQKR